MPIVFKKPVDSEPAPHSLLSDIWGIAWIALSVLIACALFSYSSLDGGINARQLGDVRNWAGPGGAFVADIAYTAFGLLAITIPCLLGCLGVVFLLHKRAWIAPSRVVGIFCVVLALSVLLQSWVSLQAYMPFPPGGLLGETVLWGLAKLWSVVGARIVAVALLLSGMVLLLQKRLTEQMSSSFNLLKERLGLLSKRQSSVSSVVLPVVKIKPDQTPIHSPSPFMEIREKPDISTGQQAQIIERDFSRSKQAIEEAKRDQSKRVHAYVLPPLHLLDHDVPTPIVADEKWMRAQAERLEKTFSQFGIEGHVREIRPGPVVTMYEFVPAPGIKLSRIASLADDIAMAIQAIHVRVVAPLPGKGAVGIEVPNQQREMVYAKEIVADPGYRQKPQPLWMAVGKDIEGKPYQLNLADMPHMLIAGTTGSGKSVSMNAMICSILYRATPEDVRFLMIDPKMLELNVYAGIPHLLVPPIIDSKKAAVALKWVVREMEDRYQRMSAMGVRDIEGYNKRLESEPKEGFERMPFIVVVVDEYADLVAVGGRDVEAYVMRLAQKARAAGIHVILATQRPSVDVITGVIKANFPVRISFRLASAVDSKTILNRQGAEKLLGKGDALIMPPGTSDLIRVHGAYISEKELAKVVEFWKSQGEPQYREEILTPTAEDLKSESGITEKDERYDEAVEMVRRTGKCSVSWLQRHLGVGFNRAARMVEQMEAEGVVGPPMNARGDREITGMTNEEN